jgi:hypothetical protein
MAPTLAWATGRQCSVGIGMEADIGRNVHAWVMAKGLMPAPRQQFLYDAVLPLVFYRRRRSEFRIRM